MNKFPQKPTNQSGMLLIEVLISLLIFSFAILGLVGLQVTATKNSYSAEDRVRAALMANEIVSTMWLQKTLSLPTATVTAWTTRLQTPSVSGLPNATGTISAPDANGVVTITITWQEPTRASTAPASQYLTQVAMPT